MKEPRYNLTLTNLTVDDVLGLWCAVDKQRKSRTNYYGVSLRVVRQIAKQQRVVWMAWWRYKKAWKAGNE